MSYKNNNHCVDCGKLICDISTRCNSCGLKESWKYRERKPEIINHCIDCNTLIGQGATRCKPCADKTKGKNPAYRLARSIGVRKAHAEGKYGEEWKKKISDTKKAQWEDDDFRRRMIKCREEWKKSPEDLKKMSIITIELWKDPEWRAKQIATRTSDQYRKLHYGPSHHWWKGGISDYSTYFNTELRHLIRERDNFTCQYCGAIEKERCHDVHHINYDPSDDREKNLMTLCMSCHSQSNWNRPYWTTLLHLKILYIYGERIENAQNHLEDKNFC